MCIIVLIILLMRTRRKDHRHPPACTEPVLTAMDVKLRPKSTNVDLQGVCPLPTSIDSGKTAPWQTAEELEGKESEDLELKEGTNLVPPEEYISVDDLEKMDNIDPEKVPEIFNLMMEDDRTGKPLLDLQALEELQALGEVDLQALSDVDPNSFRNSV